MKEKGIKEKIKQILKSNKIFYFMPSASIYGKSGVADFICCINGAFIAIEAKYKSKQTSLQSLWQNELVHAKGVYMLIDENNIDILDEKIKELKCETV